MEENKNSSQEKSKTQDVEAQKTSPIEKQNVNPIKKKKKFNGHLRSHNKRERHVPREDNIKDDIIEDTISTTIRPIYSDLFYLLRQKFFSNSGLFFEKLEEILKTTAFKEIKEGHMTLFSYAALYEKTDILKKLNEKYSHEIDKTDFEDNLVGFCLNKSAETLHVVIDVFNDNLKISDSFKNNLFSKMAKISYRDLNNSIVLKWLEPHLTAQDCEHFWTKTFQEKNISLTNTTLNHCKTLKNYLKANYNNFEPLIEIMGKKIEINRNLKNLVSENKENNEVLDIPENKSKIYLSDKDEQLQNFTKEEVTTKVVIKRKKSTA